VIDSPALEEVADGRILAAAADATVLVLRMNKSMQRSGVLALNGLNEVGANVLGAVANDVRTGASFRLEADPWQYAFSRKREALTGLNATGSELPSLTYANGNGSPGGNGSAQAASNGSAKGSAKGSTYGSGNGAVNGADTGAAVGAAHGHVNGQGHGGASPPGGERLGVNPFSDAFPGPLPHFSSEAINVAEPNWPAEKP
jgi:hypothetical protein